MESKHVKPWIKDVSAYVPGKTIEGCVKLTSNENNYGPSPKVLSALAGALSKINKYPYKDDLVRKKTASYCGVSPENILLGNGSDEIIDLVMKVFRGPVLSFKPTFSCYGIAATAYGEEYLEVALREDFSFPVEAFLAAAKKANILFLCNPNNPTGGIIPPEEIRSVLDLGKTTVVDEAYFEFYGKSAVPLIEEYDNLIVLRTFAKAFALAGLRIGYAVASKEMIDLLYKVKPPFNVNLLAQEAALAALEDIGYMESSVKKILEGKRRVFDGLAEKFKAFPSQSNFILVDTSPLPSKEFCERLSRAGVVVRDLGRFEGFSGEYARVSLGTKEENSLLLDALREI